MRYVLGPVALLAITIAQPALARHHANPPQPAESPILWLQTDDYPPAALRNNEQGTVGFALQVDDQGRVTDCRIDSSSGYPDLDASTCSRLMHRAHFIPATDKKGRSVAGIYAHKVSWRLPG